MPIFVIMLLMTDFLYTAIGEPMQNGMIRMSPEGEVLEVGQYLQSEPSEVKYLPGGICPGFINTHCHLELSHLHQKIAKGKGLPSFIKGVQKERQADVEAIKQAIKVADENMWKNGIVAVGDISNGSSSFHQKTQSKIHYHTFIELFGFDPEKATTVWKRGKELKATAEKMGLIASLVPHSPYSVSKELFFLLSEEKDNRILSIHNQETAAENELYQTKSGELKEMLESFGLSTEHLKAKKQNSLPTYLPLLDEEKPLLLVHNTFTSASDLEQAERLHPHLYWCFCPAANQYIEKRLPNVKNYVEADAKCTLGTDSLASNDGLSILEEMKIIQAEFPEISNAKLIEWACKYGAEFLGLTDFGTLEIGKKPGLNWLKGLECDKQFNQVKVEKLI